MSLDMSRKSHLEQVGHCVLVQLKLSCNSHLEQVGHHVLVQLNLSCNTGKIIYLTSFYFSAIDQYFLSIILSYLLPSQFLLFTLLSASS